MEIRATRSVWCSSPEQFAHYKNAEPEHRFDYCTLADTDSGMELYGWILLGTAEIVCNVAPIEDGIAAAIAACDLAKQKLREQFNDKLAEISAVRQNLLALPAPKNGEDDDIPF